MLRQTKLANLVTALREQYPHESKKELVVRLGKLVREDEDLLSEVTDAVFHRSKKSTNGTAKP